MLWNEIAHALSIGAEVRANVKRVHFSNCDVIHDKGREWVLRVFHCDDAEIRDITFDNIRIEESKRLISLWIGKTVWSKDAERGHIADITFRNISAAGLNSPVEVNGFDGEHVISNVRFQNVAINGQQLNLTNVIQKFAQNVSVQP